jgi:hypothetical protein
MIGLLKRGSEVYAHLVALYAQRQTSLTRLDVMRVTGMSACDLRKVLRVLALRKFVGISESGNLVPLTPPHELVCAAVCAELSVTMDEVCGRSQDYTHLRARRLIAKRLRFDFHYPVSAISKVINRHRNVVDEYFHRERASRRSKQRVERFRARKEREMRLAA